MSEFLIKEADARAAIVSYSLFTSLSTVGNKGECRCSLSMSVATNKGAPRMSEFLIKEVDARAAIVSYSLFTYLSISV